MTAEERSNYLIRKLARSAKADLALRYLDIKVATSRADAVWQPFQVEILNEVGMFAIQTKSRQIGASFTLSGDALCDGLLKPNHTVIATSFNLEEAKEKVRYIKNWWDSRHPEPWHVPTDAEFDGNGMHTSNQGNRVKAYPELIRTNSLFMEWSNGFRFFSHPSKPPRGKRASVILDEFAITPGAGPIYTAAIPMVTRGRGENTVRIASTPLGSRGKFYEIFTDERTYADYVRWSHGWWEIFDLCDKENYFKCRDAFLAGVPVEERIRLYGTPQMKIISRNADLESILQEYDLAFQDAINSFIPLELILACQPPYYIPNLDIESGDEYIEDQDPDEIERALERSYIGFEAAVSGLAARPEEVMHKVYAAITGLEEAIAAGLVSPNLVLAYDCGRTKDAAEIVIFELVGGMYKMRLMLTMRQIPFEHQRSVFNAIYNQLPIRRGMLDQGGIGMDIAEWAEKKWGPLRAEPVAFTTELKAEWAVTLKLNMERRKVTILINKDLTGQLQSVKREVNKIGNAMTYVVADEDVNTGNSGTKIKHHADKFWVVAMAVWKCDQMDHSGGTAVAAGETQARALTASVVAKGFRAAKSARGGARNLTAKAWNRMGRQ